MLNLKKSKKSPPAWSDYIKFLYEWRKEEKDQSKAAKLDEKIQETSRRALQSVQPAEHKFFLMKRAAVEYRVGEIEKGRTTLEQLISKAPNKGDVWNVYLDMEVKYGTDIEASRNLFRRACSLGLKPKVMKGFFTKWMSFETKQNNHKMIAEVKKQATAYIANCEKKLLQGDETVDNELEDDNGEVEV